MIRLGLVCAIVAFAGLETVRADVITEFDRATFESALLGGTVSGQNFDALPLGTITTVNGVTYSASLGSALVTDAFLTTTMPNGLGSTSDGFFDSTELATITFASPITAFAIDINTFAPTAGDYLVMLNDGAIDLSRFDVFPGSATGQFIGFTDSVPFTSVTISAQVDPNGQRYAYTLDTLVYGSADAINNAAATPEPSTFGLLAAGIGLLIWKTRRRYR